MIIKSNSMLQGAEGTGRVALVAVVIRIIIIRIIITSSAASSSIIVIVRSSVITDILITIAMIKLIVGY